MSYYSFFLYIGALYFFSVCIKEVTNAIKQVEKSLRGIEGELSSFRLEQRAKNFSANDSTDGLWKKLVGGDSTADIQGNPGET
jgi:hypothetical protein